MFFIISVLSSARKRWVEEEEKEQNISMSEPTNHSGIRKNHAHQQLNPSRYPLTEDFIILGNNFFDSGNEITKFGALGYLNELPAFLPESSTPYFNSVLPFKVIGVSTQSIGHTLSMLFEILSHSLTFNHLQIIEILRNLALALIIYHLSMILIRTLIHCQFHW